MLEERERACDEEGLRNTLPAKSLCRCDFARVPAVCGIGRCLCVAGVTGADLKKRTEAIMINRKGLNTSMSKKLLLAGAAVLSVAV